MSKYRIFAAFSQAARFAVSNGGKLHLLSGALCLLLASLPLTATTVPYKSFDDLVKEADAVVSGRVAQVESKYSPEKEIFTFVTLDQLDTVAGSYTGSTLTLRFLGGQIGNDISHVVGSPTFNVDDRVVLFVQGNGRYMVPLVGWTQGVFRVQQDATTGQLAVRDNEGNRVAGVQNGRLVKDLVAQPEAHIVGEMKEQASQAAERRVGLGLADYGESRIVAGAAPAPLSPGLVAPQRPAISYERFKGAIAQAAVGRKAGGRLESVSLMDFRRPSPNADAAVGPNAPARQVVDQGPALPKPTPITPQDDQR
jgi:hypothetical protein